MNLIRLLCCAVQGRMGPALQYLSLVPGDVAPDIAVLKDRIHRSGAPDVAASPEPMFPFIAEDVPVDPSAVQQASAYSHLAAYPQNTQAGEPTVPGHDLRTRGPLGARGMSRQDAI